MEEKSYSLETDHDNRLIHYRHWGKIIPEDIGKVWEELLENEAFTQEKYNLLSDYRRGEFIASSSDIEMICDILYSLENILKGKKQALILDSPMNTALSVIFEGKVMKKVGFIVKVFSTEEAALDWITY